MALAERRVPSSTQVAPRPVGAASVGRIKAGHVFVDLAVAVVLATAAFTVWWNSREPSVYTTDVRVAVMPLDNKTHPDRDPLVAGLSRVVYEMLDEASRRIAGSSITELEG